MNTDRQDHDWKILDWTPPILFVERNGEQHRFVLTGSANRPRFSWQGHYQTTFEPLREAGNSSADGSTVSPMPGTVLEIKVQVGDEVSAGQILVVVEAMKMELPVKAPAPRRIQEVLVNVGDSVAQGKSLVVLSEEDQDRKEQNREKQNREEQND